MALGTSHSPALHLRAEDYPRYAAGDRHGRRLLDRGGNPTTYEALAQEAGDRFAREIRPEAIAERVGRCRAGLDRLASALGDCALDALIIVGDDQYEHFHDDNMPAVSVYWGETVAGAGPDGRLREFPVASALGRHLIEYLTAHDFDVSHSRPLGGAHGEGHAYSFVRHRLIGMRKLPVLPIMLNTYFPPNRLLPGRCYALGRAIGEAVEAWGAGRIAILASGGLSHYAVDEALDGAVLDACRYRDGRAIAALPLAKLNSGNSEIRNWIAVAGAAEDLPMRWHDYVPCYRTPAGTGCGMAFAVWSAGAG